jgi:hypothetical protein
MFGVPGLLVLIQYLLDPLLPAVIPEIKVPKLVV